MPDSNDQEPKIFVDSDWKEEAKREKERLEQESQEAQEQGAPAEPSLLEVVQMIAVQALASLGQFADPRTGQPMQPNPPAAKHFIDLLGLFIEKVGDQWDPQEKQHADATLNELQMAFVQIVNALQQSPPPTEPPAEG
jgi:hypothetical protein